MLQRLLIDDLRAWRREPTRKPLLLDGARQVGKTWRRIEPAVSNQCDTASGMPPTK